MSERWGGGEIIRHGPAAVVRATAVPFPPVHVDQQAAAVTTAADQPAACAAVAPFGAASTGATGQAQSRGEPGVGAQTDQHATPATGAAATSGPAVPVRPEINSSTAALASAGRGGPPAPASVPTGARMTPPPSSEGAAAPVPEPALVATPTPVVHPKPGAVRPTANGVEQPGGTAAASTSAPVLTPAAATPATGAAGTLLAGGANPGDSSKQDWPCASYNVGTKVLCSATFDNLQRLAQIVDCRLNDGDGLYSYYVHYVDFDKRLDEWVSVSRLQPFAPGNTTAEPLMSPRGAGELLSPVSQERKLTRKLKRRYEEVMHVQKGVEDLPPIDQTLEREHHERTKVKNIGVVEMGKYEMDAWYYSPFPEAYSNQDKLYMCEFCLKYMKKKKTLLRHRAKCAWTHPPGDEIYRSPPPPPDNPSYVGGPVFNPPVSMFEVDGKQNKIYCQNLCLLSKLFLDHKTLYYDVDPFLFYILTEHDAAGHHVVGYFSKEKASQEEYNLACILTLPPHQRKGYGRFLIAFSYELSKKEGRVGTPERPLSDLGQVSYRSYWTRVLLDILKEHKGNLSIKDISQMTAIRADDIVSTLQSLNLIKYWKGQHIISVTPRVLEEHLKVVNAQKYVSCVDASRLHWAPLLSPTAGKKPR